MRLLERFLFLLFFLLRKRIEFYEQRGSSLRESSNYFLTFLWTSEINIVIEKFMVARQKVLLAELVTALQDFLIYAEESI